VLQELFRRSGAKYEASVFACELRAFCEWLQQSGYCKDNIRGHLRRLFKVLTDPMTPEPGDVWADAELQRAFGLHCTSVGRSHDFRGTERA
jgi:hypothetical protein